MNRVITLLLLLTAGYQLNATIVYVKGNASGSNNGTSWTNAYTSLQTAIGSAVFGDSIWIAAGTYKAAFSDRSLSFNIKNGVSMFGGFAGTETDISQRNISSNVTTLSGDIGTAGVASDNTYHILMATNINFNTTIDGFRIMDGNASTGYPYGAGLKTRNSKITVRNCTFINNQTVAEGAAIYHDNTAMTVENCNFLYNSSSSNGPAISILNGDIRITGCIFNGNQSTAGGGGAIITSGSKFVVDRCVFSGNTCDADGSAITCASACEEDTIMNSLFVGNVSYYGAVLDLTTTPNFCGYASVVLVNCTVAHNNSLASSTNPSYNAAVNFGYENYPKSMYNNIIWGNRAYAAVEGSGIDTRNNITDLASLTGNGNLFTNPQFVNPASNAAAAPFLLTGFDYHVSDLSPAIDNGCNTCMVTPYLKDLDNNTRPHISTTDIGCYEKNYCTFSPTIQLAGDSIFCNGQSAVLSAPAGRNYVWSNAATTQSITVTSSGNYSVFMIDSSYCRGTVAQTITVTTASAAITVSPSDTFCAGTVVTLTAPAAASYRWNNNSTQQAISVTNSGYYSVSVTDTAGCIATGGRSVFLSPATVSISGQSYVCTGQTIQLNASGTAGSTYEWSNGNSGSSISVGQGGNYTVTITNSNNCTATASKNITEQPVVVPTLSVSASDSSVCPQQSITFTANATNAGTPPVLIWKKNGNNVGFNGNPYVTSTLNNGDIVTVQVTSPLQCAVPATLTSSPIVVTIHPVPPIPTIQLTDTVLVSNSSTGNQWLVNGGIIAGANGNTHVPSQNGYYSVSVTNQFGCSSTSSTLFVNLSGIDDMSSQMPVIFPNPATDNIIIQNIQPGTNITITDVWGRMVRSFISEQNKIAVDVTTLAPGMYFINKARFIKQ